jgi:hypothetical protein
MATANEEVKNEGNINLFPQRLSAFIACFSLLK